MLKNMLRNAAIAAIALATFVTAFIACGTNSSAAQATYQDSAALTERIDTMTPEMNSNIQAKASTDPVLVTDLSAIPDGYDADNSDQAYVIQAPAPAESEASIQADSSPDPILVTDLSSIPDGYDASQSDQAYVIQAPEN